MGMLEADFPAFASLSCCDLTALIAAVYLAIYVIFVHESTERRHLRFAQAVLADHAVHLEDEAASLRVQTRHFTHKHDRLASSLDALQKKLKATEKQIAVEKKLRLSKETLNSKLVGDIDSVNNHIRFVSRDLRQQKKQSIKYEAHIESLHDALKSCGVHENIISSDMGSSTKSETSYDHPSEESPGSSLSYVTNSSPTETVDSDIRAQSSDSVHTPKKECQITSALTPTKQRTPAHTMSHSARGVILAGLQSATHSPTTLRNGLYPTDLSKSPV